MGRGSPELMTGVERVWWVWRGDVSRPEVIEGLDRGWDVSSQKVLGCEGAGRATGHRRPEGVDLTADGADDTDKKGPEGMAAEMALSGPTTLPALWGVPLIREIREIRGPFFGRSRVGHASWAPCPPPQPLAFVVGSAGPQTTQKDAELHGAGLRLGARPYQSGGGRTV